MNKIYNVQKLQLITQTILFISTLGQLILKYMYIATGDMG